MQQPSFSSLKQWLVMPINGLIFMPLDEPSSKPSHIMKYCIDVTSKHWKVLTRREEKGKERQGKERKERKGRKGEERKGEERKERKGKELSSCYFNIVCDRPGAVDLQRPYS